MRRRALLAAGTAAMLPGGTRADDRDPEMLRVAARQATVHLFPVYEMARLRWQATVDDANPQRQRLNRFRHYAELADHRVQPLGLPNSDTLYSSAWLELGSEPMFLTVPPVGDLYYCYAAFDLSGTQVGIVSHRRHGGAPPTHMIVGPAWDGVRPSDVHLIRSTSNSAWLLGRVLVDGPEEVDRARILQGRALLETPDQRNERRILEAGELMRFRTVAPPEPVADWPVPHPADPFDLFDIGLQALGEGPLSERDRAALEGLAPLKLRPGRRFDRRAFGEDERRAIVAGIADGHAAIRTAARDGGQRHDGWRYGARLGDDDLSRAAAAFTGLGALEPAEAVYVFGEADATGRRLSGDHAYRLTFPPDGLPPAQAFWSLAAYTLDRDGRAHFVDNAIARHAVGDRTPGLQPAPDGGLVLHLQTERPRDVPPANWLPLPPNDVLLVLRAYEPEAALIEGRYRLPAVQRIAPR